MPAWLHTLSMLFVYTRSRVPMNLCNYKSNCFQICESAVLVISIRAQPCSVKTFSIYSKFLMKRDFVSCLIIEDFSCSSFVHHSVIHTVVKRFYFLLLVYLYVVQTDTPLQLVGVLLSYNVYWVVSVSSSFLIRTPPFLNRFFI